MSKYLQIFPCAAALFVGVLFSPVCVAEIQDLDEIIAIVNNDVIMRSELETKTREIIAQLKKKGASIPPLGLLQKQILDRLVLARLQLEVAERAGIHVDDNTINQYIQRLATGAGVSTDGFREILEQDGYSFDTFRENLRKEITIKQVQNRQIAGNLRVTDREVERYLAKQIGSSGRSAFRIGHIYISVPEAATPDQISTLQKKANGILTELKNGTEFTELAIAFSDAPQALEGGDLGWRNADQVPTLFADVVGDMERGQISSIMKAPSGFHIIQLIDFKGEDKHVIAQTKAQHILIKTNDLVSDDDAITRLEQLRERILAGENFSSLAQVHSDDKATSVKGGDLGWVSPGDVVPAFQQQMQDLEKNGVSETFRTPFGWHIVKVLDRRDHDNTQEFRRSRAKEDLKKSKLEHERLLFLRRLRDEAYVEYQTDKF